jgi:hypothetical protein
MEKAEDTALFGEGGSNHPRGKDYWNSSVPCSKKRAGAFNAPQDLQGVLPHRFKVFGHFQIGIRILYAHMPAFLSRVSDRALAW